MLFRSIAKDLQDDKVVMAPDTKAILHRFVSVLKIAKVIVSSNVIDKDVDFNSFLNYFVDWFVLTQKTFEETGHGQSDKTFYEGLEELFRWEVETKEGYQRIIMTFMSGPDSEDANRLSATFFHMQEDEEWLKSLDLHRVVVKHLREAYTSLTPFNSWLEEISLKIGRAHV